MAWGKCDAKSDVQPLAYDDVREHTALGSQHSILATHQAAQAITGCIERRAKGKKVSKPMFTSPTVKYDTRTMTLFDDDTVSLSTTESRVRCPLALPDADDGYQRQYLHSDEWGVTKSTLTARDGEYFLHIGFRRHKNDTERNTAEDGTVLGVDLGIENLAVTSTAYFFSGRELTHNLREFEKVRAGLQQTGTRSAHRTLVQSSGRELRYVRDVLHRASNALIDEALRYDCDVIAFENLTDIRDRTGASWGHKWAFRTLYEQVEYKAETVDVSVKQVGSAYTSNDAPSVALRQTRIVRLVTTSGVRSASRSRTRTTMRSLDYVRRAAKSHSDFATAKNIGMRYVRRGQQSSRRTDNSQLVLKSGTVTPSGGFTAHPDGFEAEFMDKPHPPRAKSSD